MLAVHHRHLMECYCWGKWCENCTIWTCFLSIREHCISFCWWATGEPWRLIQSGTKSLGTWWVQELHYNHCVCVWACTHAQMCFCERNICRKSYISFSFVTRVRVLHPVGNNGIALFLCVFVAVLKCFLKYNWKFPRVHHHSREVCFVWHCSCSPFPRCGVWEEEISKRGKSIDSLRAAGWTPLDLDPSDSLIIILLDQMHSGIVLGLAKRPKAATQIPVLALNHFLGYINWVYFLSLTFWKLYTHTFSEYVVVILLIYL